MKEIDATYDRSATTVTLIRYHFVFCPRYRRKVFDVPGVEARFKELALEACDAMGAEVLAMECDRDHAHLFLQCPPALSPADVMAKVKGPTSRALRAEFPALSRMPGLWTRSYFCASVGELGADAVREYVESQKRKRGSEGGAK